MPIDIDRFEESEPRKLRAETPTNGEKILGFLASHADKAFTPKEIHERTDIARGSVGVVLSRLEDRGLVRHRGSYWAIDDPEEVDATLTAIATARAATDRFGPEDPEEWGPGVESGDE
ncbi:MULTISPECIES: MarR family transcriptional regulator [Salinibaculum]|uniref:MarR family transcriptional regulator n=1 Tax=Salinibaculum TaxID=2732368 RepID=UPI0030CF59EA